MAHFLSQNWHITLTAVITATCGLPFQPLTAAEEAKEHPSTSSQIRLASWWFDRHADLRRVVEGELACPERRSRERQRSTEQLVGTIDGQVAKRIAEHMLSHAPVRAVPEVLGA